MEPLESCPVCQVPVYWAGHKGINCYDCSNQNCPIQFTEYVFIYKNNTNFTLKDGVLQNYGFKIDKYYIIAYAQMSGYSVAINDKQIFLPYFEINWNNLDLVKQRIETLILFS